jgi:Ca-activated chloride channel family protein
VLTGPAYTLRVLGSSELADMTPILQDAARATGVTVQLTPIGSLAGAQAVLEGTTTSACDQGDGKSKGACDAVWFASDRYLYLNPGSAGKFDGTTQIMSSPVILGLRTSVAQRLGWQDRPPSWSEIAEAAARHAFTFAMTDPAKSNSGLSALVSVATAVAGGGGALQAAQVPAAIPQISALFHAQVLKGDPSAGSSGWLTNTFLKDLSPASGVHVDGLIDYESELLRINATTTPAHEPLTLIYPSDGVVPADYPLSVLATAPPAAKDAYQRLAAYLRTPEAQARIMAVTHRRPVTGGIPLATALAAHQPYELPFPGTLETVSKLIAAYQDSARRPGRTVYVLDVSGSMRGQRIAMLKQALVALTGADPTAFGRSSRFENGEQITLLPFSTTPAPPATFNMPPGTTGPVLGQIRDYIRQLTADGSTAMYDALRAAYKIIATQHAADPDRIESIVLLTDGESNTGLGYTGFAAFYRGLPAGAPPVFTILFGDAKKTELDQVAQLTGGLTFDAVHQPLATILEQIRGYQ